jgi:hypothetical protein
MEVSLSGPPRGNRRRRVAADRSHQIDVAIGPRPQGDLTRLATFVDLIVRAHGTESGAG